MVIDSIEAVDLMVMVFVEPAVSESVDVTVLLEAGTLIV